jgi:excisionase family DNA binding protein
MPSGSGSGSGNAERQAAYTLPEAAAALGMSERTLRAKVERGEIAAERTDRGHYRIAAAVLELMRQGAAAERLPLGKRQRQDAARHVSVSGSGNTAEVEFLRARLVAAEERERELLATVRDLRALLLAQTVENVSRGTHTLPREPEACGRFPHVSPPPRPAPSPRWRWRPWFARNPMAQGCES